MKDIYLDTNVFAHAQAEGAEEQLISWARSSGRRVLVTEVHVGEALAIKHPAERAARIELLASLPIRWPPPLGYLQSREVVNEIRRLRPAWRRLPTGDESYSRALLRSHQEGGRMLRRRDVPRLEQTHEAYSEIEEPAIAGSRSSQKVMREHLRGGNPTTREVVLGGRHFEIDPPLNLSILDGFCRFESLAAWWGALFARQATLADYTNHSDPYVNVSGVPERDFVAFWLNEVDLHRLPRGLSSSAVVFGQLEERIEHGNPADVRHAGYLPDATYFVTEDRGFQAALGVAARELALPEPLFVERAQPLVEQLQAVVGG